MAATITPASFLSVPLDLYILDFLAATFMNLGRPSMLETNGVRAQLMG